MNCFRQYLSATACRQHGFSMVEILVALLLSLILTTGIIQLFIGSKQTYRFHDALSRLQENGRFAIESMAADIRMAGYIAPGPLPLGSPSPPNPMEAVGTINNGIEVRWFDPGPAPNQCSPLPPQNGICYRAYSIGPGTGPAPACPAAANSLRLNRGDGSGAQELIEGVQAMQILYGVCTNGVVNPPYVNAAGVGAAANWANVCSVRIHLLLVSMENNVVTQPQTVFFPADTVNTIVPADRCLRQAFSTTVAIRNRIP